MHCIALHCIVLNFIVLYCIALQCIVLYCIVLYCIVLYCNDKVKPNFFSDRRNNFRKYDRSTIDSLGTPYDYGSLMHYGSRAFSSNRQPTILVKQSGVSYEKKRNISPRFIFISRHFRDTIFLSQSPYTEQGLLMNTNFSGCVSTMQDARHNETCIQLFQLRLSDPTQAYTTRPKGSVGSCKSDLV